MTERSPYLPTIQPFFEQGAIAQTVENKQTAMPVNQSQSDNGLLQIGGAAVGGAAIFAVFAELLKKFGNNEIESRKQKIDQELKQERDVANFYLKQADKDAETINTTLNLFVTKHLDTTVQLFDLYYSLAEEHKNLKLAIGKYNERLESIEILLKDILAVLSMRDRQNKS